MKVLITGITGLIGKHFALRLLQDQTFTIIGHYHSTQELSFYQDRNIALRQADICDKAATIHLCKDCDIVVHTAARVIDFGNKDIFYQTHYDATQYLLEDALKHHVKHFIYLSSVGVTSGLSRKKELPTESTLLVKTGILYDDVKIDTEQLVIDFCQQHHIAYTIVRPSAIVGPNSVWVREPIERTLSQGNFPLINGGRNSACLIDVRNLAEGLYKIVTLPIARNQIYFFTDDFTHITWRTYFSDLLAFVGKNPGISIPYACIYPIAVIMEWVANLTGKKPFLAKKSIKALGTDRRVSTDKAKKELTWKTLYNYSQTMEYIRQWIVEERFLERSREI